MPHQCTTCNTIYDDGADTILSGCDKCGGQKYQFIADATVARLQSNTQTDASDTQSTETDSTADTHDADSVLVAEPETINAESTTDEDAAQAQARTQLHDTVLWPDSSSPTASDDDLVVADSPTPDEPSDASLDVADVQEELADQFGSIRIVEPGEYELDLMDLYESDDFIISLEPNGEYIVESVGNWTPNN